MACIIEDPGNGCRSLLSHIFMGREEESSLVILRVIHVSDLGNLKSQLYLIFKTSPWTLLKQYQFQLEVRQTMTGPLKIYMLSFEGYYPLGILHSLTQTNGSKYIQSKPLC